MAKIEVEDIEVIDVMRSEGGGFVRALAECLAVADSINRQKLKDA